MAKYDIKRARRELYTAPTRDVVLVDVPELTYLAVDGHGDPNTSERYAAAVEALYAVAYTIKFDSKRTLGRDFVVAPLEALWRAADPAAFTRRAKDDWDWTVMIAQPEWVAPDDVERARRAAAAKKDLPAVGDLRLLTLAEGPSLQILHVGPYDDEGPVLARLHDDVMPARGLTFGGDHHEIYLSDPRRAAPERLRTILRQPVRPVSATADA